MNSPILSVKGLSMSFELKGSWGRSAGTLRAVDNVSFDISSGETLGLVVNLDLENQRLDAWWLVF